jgi:integrase
MLTDTKVAAIKPPVAGQDEHKDSGPGYVRGLRLRVGTSGKKTWIVRARAGEKLINKKLGMYPAMRLAAARKAATGLLDTIARDGSAAAAERTFGDLAAAWLEKKRADKKHNKSVDHQSSQLDRHVLPKWRDRKIVDIKRADVRDLIEGIEGDVLPNRVFALVRTIFRYALSRDWLEASPAEGISRPKDESARDRFLDMDEAKRVWDAATLLGYPYGPYVRALLLTGQRRTEVASMRWNDVDLDGGTWMLKAGDTKAERAHLVPLSEPILEVLKALPQLGDYVFTTDGKTHISSYAKGKARLDTFLSAAGEPLEPWTFHDLRRTVSSHMARLGISTDIRGRVLNHAVQGVTERHYTPYDFQAEKRSALDRWAAELLRAVEGRGADKVVPLHSEHRP